MRARLAALAAAATLSAAIPAAAQPSDAQCDEANLRIYFAQDETTLDADAVQVLRLAERQVAQCPYAELRVLMNADAPHARERADAILAAADGRAWNVARVERREEEDAGPVYAQVLMTPRVLPDGEELTAEGDAGV